MPVTLRLEDVEGVTLGVTEGVLLGVILGVTVGVWLRVLVREVDGVPEGVSVPEDERVGVGL